MSENPTINDDLLVRPYLPRDLVDVGRIYASLGRVPATISYAGSYVCCFMQLPVGVIVPQTTGTYLHIKELCTLRQFQKQGVASNLINFVKSKAVEFDKIKSVVVKIPLDNEHKDAISFFKKRYEFVQSVNDTLVFLDRVSNTKELTTWSSLKENL